MSTLPYIGIVILIGLSAYFSGSEIAFASASRLRLRSRADDESSSLSDKMALYVYDRFDDALSSILVGNNLVNIASSSVATVIAISILGEGYAWVATAVMTFVIIIFGEIMPKILASRDPDRFAARVSLPLRALMWLLKPLTWLVNSFMRFASGVWHGRETDEAVTADDLETLIEAAEDEGVIEEERCDLLQNALDFGDLLAYEIITPRVDMISIDIDDDFDKIMETLDASPYSRIPVYEESIDNIIGILHLNQVYRRLTEEETLDTSLLRELMLPVCFVHKTMPLDDVLAAMRARHSHMVIVTDEYGGTMGCLTMEDVLEQIVGDIWDETDEVDPEFKKVGRDLYEADGDMRTMDLFEELDMDERDFEDDNATLGGWTIEMLNGYPKVGDSFVYKNLTITVKRRHNMRVTKLTIKAEPPAEAGEQ